MAKSPSTSDLRGHLRRLDGLLDELSKLAGVAEYRQDFHEAADVLLRARCNLVTQIGHAWVRENP